MDGKQAGRALPTAAIAAAAAPVAVGEHRLPAHQAARGDNLPGNTRIVAIQLAKSTQRRGAKAGEQAASTAYMGGQAADATAQRRLLRLEVDGLATLRAVHCLLQRAAISTDNVVGAAAAAAATATVAVFWHHAFVGLKLDKVYPCNAYLFGQKAFEI